MRTVLIGVAACVLAGCASSRSGPAAIGTTWVLDAAPAPAPTVLLADADKASGFAGVNRWFSEYRISGTSEGKLSFGKIGTTLMAGPADAMERETRFVAALQSVDAYRRSESRLELLSRGQVLLTFTPEKPEVR